MEESDREAATQVRGFQVYSRQKWDEILDDVKIRKEDMNRIVMNFLLTEGFADAAQMFQVETGTEHMDIATASGRMEVKIAVTSGDYESAFRKVVGLIPNVLDSNPELFFQLHVLRMVELIRDGKLNDAFEIARNELAPIGEKNSRYRREIERTMMLLVYEDLSTCPYKDILDISQLRLKTANELNEAILKSQTDCKGSMLKFLHKMMEFNQHQLGRMAAFPQIKDMSTNKIEYSMVTPFKG